MSNIQFILTIAVCAAATMLTRVRLPGRQGA